MTSEIAAALRLRRSGRQFRGLCPLCGKDAFSLAEGQAANILVFCFAGCTADDLLAEIRRRGLIEGREPETLRTAPRIAPPRPAAPLDWSSKAEHVWSQGEPVTGSPVAIYLRERGCALPQSDELRFLPGGIFGPHLCMMARITDAITAKPLTLHFTRLQDGGARKADVEKPKLLLGGHRKAGGVVRLVEDAEVGLGLGIAEGIETALSVMAAGWSPVWATVDAGNMESFPVLCGIEALAIWADNDKSKTGEKSAEECAARWRQAGREVAICTPPTVGQDWNDLVKSA